jgi:hypothetical protein
MRWRSAPLPPGRNDRHNAGRTRAADPDKEKGASQRFFLPPSHERPVDFQVIVIVLPSTGSPLWWPNKTALAPESISSLYELAYLL